MMCNFYLNKLCDRISFFFVTQERIKKHELINVPKKAGFFGIFELFASSQSMGELPSVTLTDKGSSILNSFLENYYYNIDPLELNSILDSYGLSDFSMFYLGLSLWFFYAVLIILSPLFKFKKFLPLSSQYFHLNNYDNNKRWMQVKSGILLCLFIIQILSWQYKAGISILNSFMNLVISQDKMFFISLPFVIFSLVITCSCLIFKTWWDWSKGNKISKLSIAFLGYSITVLALVVIVFVLKSSGYDLNESILQFLVNLGLLIDFVFFGKHLFEYYGTGFEGDNLFKIVNNDNNNDNNNNSNPTSFAVNNGEGGSNTNSRGFNNLNNEEESDDQRMQIDSDNSQSVNNEGNGNISDPTQSNNNEGNGNTGVLEEDTDYESDDEKERSNKRDQVFSHMECVRGEISDKRAIIDECVEENEESSRKIDHLIEYSKQVRHRMEVNKMIKENEEGTSRKRKADEMESESQSESQFDFEAENEKGKNILNDIQERIKKEEDKKDENDELIGKTFNERVKLEDEYTNKSKMLVNSIKTSVKKGYEADVNYWRTQEIIDVNGKKITRVKNQESDYVIDRESSSESESESDGGNNNNNNSNSGNNIENDNQNTDKKDKRARNLNNSLLFKPIDWDKDKDRGRGGGEGSSTGN